MNVVDSSGWLEYFADGPNAEFFAPAIENVADLLVPSISIYEVFKRILQQRGEDAALKAIVAMQQAKVSNLDTTLALSAALLSYEKKIPMADSIILATARSSDATIWTQDGDFEGLEKVQYIAKP